MAKKNLEPAGNASAQEKTLSRINEILDKNKDSHYNALKEIKYRIPTSSLRLDIALDGGLTPGLHRFCGISEGGKTSCALQIAANFQKLFPEKGMVVYVKAEGRLDERVLERSGIDTDPKKFCLLKSNVYEFIFQTISKLVKENEEETLFFFIIDSMDALCLSADLQKGFDEPDKVAGGALMASVFLRKMSLCIESYGHIGILISQVRTKVDPNAGRNGGPTQEESGGNAIRHYSNYILEFQKRYTSDKIYANPNATTIAAKGEILGHFCKIKFRKSINEKTDSEISYPIKYGRTGGKSVWVEYEVLELLRLWQMVEQSGAWNSFTQEAVDYLKSCDITDIDTDYKICGNLKLFEFLESRADIVNAFIKYFKDKISCKKVSIG